MQVCLCARLKKYSTKIKTGKSVFGHPALCLTTLKHMLRISVDILLDKILNIYP